MPVKPPTHRPNCVKPPWRDGRPSPAARGYDHAWAAFSRGYLDQHPLCVECLKEGRYVSARHTDHIITLAERPDLKFDESNLQGLCVTHHSRKTATEDRGFGRSPKVQT